MTILPYRERGFVRFVSSRTGETLFEMKMLGGAIIVWGRRYRPDEFDALLADDAQTVALLGTLRDSEGPVVKFGHYAVISAPYSVEIGELPADYNPHWTKDRT